MWYLKKYLHLFSKMYYTFVKKRRAYMHFPIYSKFFYYKLNEQEKKAYTNLLNSWLSYKKRVMLVNVSMDLDFNKIFKSICDDTPELFYIDFSRISVSFMPGMAIVSVSFVYSKQECESIIAKINDIIKPIIKSAITSKDREKHVHDYLAKNTKYSYDFSSFDTHTIKGALLDKSSVCEGYARAFKLLCDAVKIPCVVVSGTATNTNGQIENHAWNIVGYNSSNFHVDVTWNSAIPDGSYLLYYNVSDEFIKKDHFWDRTKWPQCKEQGETENGITNVNSINMLDTVLKSKVGKKETNFTLQFTKTFSSTKDVMDLLNERFSKNNLFEVVSFSVTYNPKLSCAIITVEY